MNIICPHCKESITLTTRPNQKIAGCTHCNGTFKIEILNPTSNKSSIVPNPDEVKILCPTCSRKILMHTSFLNSEITCPDCGNDYVASPKNVIFTISDTRVATGAQLKNPVHLAPPAPTPSAAATVVLPAAVPTVSSAKPTLVTRPETVSIRPR